MSIDGLTIMISVNRKKQKATVTQSVTCRPGCEAWGEHLGRAAWGRDAGSGHKPGSFITSSPLDRSLLDTLVLNKHRVWRLAADPAQPLLLPGHGVCAWMEHGGAPLG